MNVRFLDGLGSRGGYNYIIGGMMYSTGCWNYRLSQYRRYNKEREKNREMAKWYMLKRTLLHMYSFFGFSLRRGNIDPVIRELKKKDDTIHLFNEFLIIFFYQILLLFPRTRVHLPCLTTVISIVIIYFYVR